METKQDQLYYLRELKYLNEQGDAFAERFDQIARALRLGGDSGVRDPHTERIVEAFAFLTGKINRFLDYQFPELTGALMEMLYPAWPRPLPCKTPVRFHADESMIDKPVPIPRGTELFASGVGPRGQTYTFTTAWDVLVQPVEIDKVYEDPEADGDYKLSTVLRLHQGADMKDMAWDKLEFMLAGDPSTCQNAWLIFAEHLEAITVKGLRGSKLELEWSGFDTDHDYAGAEEGRYHKLHYIRDWFEEPRRFYCFRLKGLDAALDGLKDWQELQIDFKFNRQFATNVHLKTENLILYGCIAQNLFETTCEPFKVDPITLEYAVEADSEREDLEVHSILDVTASRDQQKTTVRPYYRYRMPDAAKARQWFYTLHHVSDREEGRGTNMRFLDLDHKGPGALEGQTVSIKARCANGRFAEALKRNQLNQISNDHVPETIKVHNFDQPTPVRRPVLHGAGEWTFLAHLALDFSELNDLDTLKTLFSLYRYPKNDTEKDERRLKGLRSLEVTRDYRIEKGCCIQGKKMSLSIDSNFFNSLGEVALFVRVLGHFLNAYVPINGFIQLEVEETRTNQIFKHTAWG